MDGFKREEAVSSSGAVFEMRYLKIKIYSQSKANIK